MGDEVEARIISVDRKSRGISISIKAKDIEEEKAAVSDMKSQEVEDNAPKSIGDLIMAQLKK